MHFTVTHKMYSCNTTCHKYTLWCSNGSSSWYGLNRHFATTRTISPPRV